ncbi:hypothetical protein B0H13DRAFT_2321233 [Mycena leptocephala]|nr:hypothetical protein B0H13DRAFT_2321233 [Mycena leptocephala]
MSFFLRMLQLPDLQIRINAIETLLTASATGTIHIASLRCLGTLPGVVMYAVLHPCKAEVLRELGDALDDMARYCSPDLLGKILTHHQ